MWSITTKGIFVFETVGFLTTVFYFIPPSPPPPPHNLLHTLWLLPIWLGLLAFSLISSDVSKQSLSEFWNFSQLVDSLIVGSWFHSFQTRGCNLWKTSVSPDSDETSTARYSSYTIDPSLCGSLSFSLSPCLYLFSFHLFSFPLPSSGLSSARMRPHDLIRNIAVTTAIVNYSTNFLSLLPFSLTLMSWES